MEEFWELWIFLNSWKPQKSSPDTPEVSLDASDLVSDIPEFYCKDPRDTCFTMLYMVYLTVFFKNIFSGGSGIHF